MRERVAPALKFAILKINGKENIMSAIVILNPYSGRWKGGERRAEIERALSEAGVAFDIRVTERPGHATELAREAVRSGYKSVLSAGGDGTISEVINGLLSAEGGEKITFGILPVGTANDLADNLKWPRDLDEAAALIAEGKTRGLDVCTLNGHYFVNNAGLGLEPYISTIQANMVRLKGNFRYLAAALTGIMKNPQWEMEMEWEGGAYSGPVTLISVGNCARTGGIFYTVPHAEPFDGKLSFIRGHIATRRGLLTAFPMIMRPDAGNVTEHPAVYEHHTTWLKVKTSTPSPAHADGEVITAGETDFEFRILPGRLQIVVA